MPVRMVFFWMVLQWIYYGFIVFFTGISDFSGGEGMVKLYQDLPTVAELL